MTRRLPWKRTSAADASNTDTRNNKTSNESTVPSPTPRLSVSSRGTPAAATQLEAVRDGASVNETVTGLLAPDRAGSTSPPPEPLSERFMIDGLDEDDKWRMVEDEFLATAQRFTAHLHAAEYQRLKSASRSQNATTIRDISRPVVGRMTDLVRMKQERKARAARIRAERTKRKARDGDGDGDGGYDDDDSDSANAGDPYGNTSLFGLMERPQKTASLLEPDAPAAAVPAATSSSGRAVGTSPMPLRVSPHAPRPTFSSIPGLRARSDKSGKRRVKGETIDIDDETTESEEDLGGSSSRLVRFSAVGTEQCDHTGGITQAGVKARRSGQAPLSSHKHHPTARMPPVTISLSQQQERAPNKSSSSASEDEDDDDDILAKLKKRRALASKHKKSASSGHSSFDAG